MRAYVAKFVRDEDGAVAIEYALILTCIALGIIASATTLGTNLSSAFINVSNGF